MSWSWKDVSYCNTTVQLDGWHPATHLGTLPTIISPVPTWLRILAYMQNCEWNAPKWTTNFQWPGHEKMLVTAILLFNPMVVILSHIWVPYLHSYHLFLLGYIQSVLAYIWNCEWNPPKWTTNLQCPGHEKDVSYCNTTVQLDGGNPATHLGTLPTLVSPLPTWLHPECPCLYIELWVESTQGITNLGCPGHEKS